jgi:PAS domain S-box-containing protein
MTIEVDRNNLHPAEELRKLRQRVAQLESEAAAQRVQRFRESEESFRLMVDAAPVMMWMAGTDMLCTFFNRNWLVFRGRTMEQELGNGWTQGVHPADLPRCLDIYTKAFEARREFQMEYRLMRHDATWRWIVDTGVPRYEPEGVFAGYIGSCVDITDLKSAPPPLVETPATPLPLTDREKQVLVLIAGGNSTKEVAAQLGISYKTADSHRSKIMEKLDVHETATLVRYAIRYNLIEA